MRVRRDGGHARNAEVEARDVVAEALAPGKDETAQASIDMKAEVVLEGDLGELFDRVDQPVRVVRRRADQGDRVLRHVIAHPVDVGDPPARQRRLEHLDAEQVPRLLQRNVSRDRDDHLRLCDPLFGAAAVPVHEQGVDEALGATERHDAAGLWGVQHGRGHRNDLRLQLGRARVHVALEHVRVRE